jgi:hypothetical protein
MQKSTDLATSNPQNFQTVWRFNDVDVVIKVVDKTFVNDDCVHDIAVAKPAENLSNKVAE